MLPFSLQSYIQRQDVAGDELAVFLELRDNAEEDVTDRRIADPLLAKGVPRPEHEHGR
jgi:hypothetical protein